MRLVEFSVTNYRSITSAHKINLQDLTVLVGKNNEGKSNLLMALNIAMTAVILHGIPGKIPYGHRRDTLYVWERDFPVQFQNRKSGLESIFRLNFLLDEREVTELHELTGIRGNEKIPISVRISKDNNPKIEVPKKGSSSYKEKSEQITNFISNKIAFNYIQAIRTEEMAIRALQFAIVSQLRILEDNPEYVKAQEKINELEQIALDSIADQLVEPLKTFLPSLNSISIDRENDYYHSNYRPQLIDVTIDDGHATSIRNKGDGIKSLVTLAILKEGRSFNGASVIAIEEPESHLHSGAIHSLVEVINKISENNQVIITTHNPLFVQQNRIASNVIVDRGTARPAKTISEIRDILGVLPADNLQNARYALIVEGENDKTALEKILPYYSESIKEALKNNYLIIKPINGAGNLPHELSELQRSMCRYIVLLDDDKQGREAAEKAETLGLLKPTELRFTICDGSAEAEFEDCIQPKVYQSIINEEYGVDINDRRFRSSKKWSIRMKEVFNHSGVRWTEATEKRTKTIVAESIPKGFSKPEDILIMQKAGFIESLAKLVDSMLNL